MDTREQWNRSEHPLLAWESNPETTPPAPPTSIPDNEAKRETLLFDRRGRPLVVRAPRPVGFRRR